jgi:hypothetical protein
MALEQLGGGCDCPRRAHGVGSAGEGGELGEVPLDFFQPVQ